MPAGADLPVWEEHRFWLEILDDHAHFVRDYLSPEEAGWVSMAQSFIGEFRRLRERLETLGRDLPLSSPPMMQFAVESQSVSAGYYRLEGHLQHLRIYNRINLNLTPTFLNGTLNENAEYLRLLTFFVRGEQPVPLPLSALLDLWLEDQLGHALLLANILDPAEIPLINRVRKAIDEFQAHLVKNQNIKGFLRFTPPNFPLQLRFAGQVARSVTDFYVLVYEVVGLYKDSEVLNRATLRFLEHHIPETCYFLRKLTDFTRDFPMIADCPLTKPSFSG
ncbi:hypothetical protein SD70_07380 [Gordoniibacillus kamchatkensis]|uniref:DUF2935 domain-containing protein n=1 Tax=Gordoniibacillus kamchatkensis TaxID=1590651 RepID=A0ABR5AKG6_9BACL|nr:DUF2935 domain-containing protein [Paenibacillus sp. VKM B-2647]KIL41450.1 hypothetical protein SD70_07380 [Paenibacillus sp. VKM B-2647]